MEAWKARGKPVRVQFNFPIQFALDGGDGESNEEGITVTAYREPGKSTKIIYSAVEEMPEFPGGKDALLKFLSDNIKYPEAARKAGIQGMVYVTFVVKKDGTIEGTRVMRGIGSGCDEEALRVVKMMKFKPGKQNGKPVDVQFNLPIKFALN